MSPQIEDQFHAAMLNIYERGTHLKPPYRATRFLQMVQGQGGKLAADQLLAAGNPSSGFTELYLRGAENLKISVEYLVLQSPWSSLFSADQLAVARKRLQAVGVEPPDAA